MEKNVLDLYKKNTSINEDHIINELPEIFNLLEIL